MSLLDLRINALSFESLLKLSLMEQTELDVIMSDVQNSLEHSVCNQLETLCSKAFHSASRPSYTQLCNDPFKFSVSFMDMDFESAESFDSESKAKEHVASLAMIFLQTLSREAFKQTVHSIQSEPSEPSVPVSSSTQSKDAILDVEPVESTFKRDAIIRLHNYVQFHHLELEWEFERTKNLYRCRLNFLGKVYESLQMHEKKIDAKDDCARVRDSNAFICRLFAGRSVLNWISEHCRTKENIPCRLSMKCVYPSDLLFLSNIQGPRPELRVGST